MRCQYSRPFSFPIREGFIAPASGHPADPKGVLGGLHPEFARRLGNFLDAALREGLDVMLWEGYRDVRTQEALYRKGGVTRARGGRSWHNYGLAADVVFRDGKRRPSWDPKYDWRRLGALGKAAGLIWGGDFRSIKDLGHFEWHPGLSLNDLYNDNNSQTKTVWEFFRIGNKSDKHKK